MKGEQQFQLRSWVQQVGLKDQVDAASQPDASSVIDKLASGHEVGDAEANSIEAIVLRSARPALIVSGGRIETPPPAWRALEEARTMIEAVLPSVGRINVSGLRGLLFAGTGFLVGEGLVMTSRAVAELFCAGVGTTGLTFREGLSPAVDFRSEGGPGEDGVRIVKVELIHPFLDLALLHVERTDVLPLQLSLASADATDGHKAVVIGHIAYDPDRDLELTTTLFGQALGCKHVSPGKLGRPQLFSHRGQQMLAVPHDCTTLSGSAGGPLIDLQTGKVIGMHVVGQRFESGFAIPTSEFARDTRIVATGLRFDGTVQPSEHAWKEHWQQAEPSEADQAEQAQAVAPRRTKSSTRRRSDLEEVRELCESTLPDRESLHKFLVTNGYEAVLRAVPPNLPDAEYREGLLKALDRRNLIEPKFLKALRAATGASPVAEEAPEEPEPVATGAVVGAGAAAAPAPLPANVISDLLAAVKGDDGAILPALALGSQWHNWLANPDGSFGTLTETVERLAHDPTPDARSALTWLVGKLVHLDGLDEASRTSLLRSFGYLASSDESRTPTLAAVLPQDDDFTDVGYLARGLDAGRGVVVVQSSTSQAAAGTFYGATGWLLTPSLVVVPAHLIHGPNVTMDKAAVEARAQAFDVRFDYDAPGAQGTKVAVAKLELIDHRLDLAILRLRTEATDRSPLHVNPDPPVPGPGFLTMIHHPGLGPKKLSIRGGRLIESDAHQVTYTMATQGGSGGAPVFDSEWRVVATHRAFQSYRPTPDSTPVRAKVGTATSALLKALRETGPEPLWREVVASQPALKVIDPTLYSRIAQLAGDGAAVVVVPMVIQVAGPSVSLDEVPDLRIGTRDDFLITATGSKASLDALAAVHGVLSVKASRESGAYECAVSIPHIGVPRIHTDLGERGENAIVAFIDSGLDIFHEAFRDDASKTRVLAFWDQKDARAPAGDPGSRKAQAMSPAGEAMVDACKLRYGALYVADDLQDFIENRKQPPATFPNVQVMVHGTAVCSIAAGRRTGDQPDVHFPGGIAPASSIVMVRYDVQESSVGYSVGHIDALTFIDQIAVTTGKPVVVNISNGMNAGAHDGTSLVEQKCKAFTGGGAAPGRIIVKSAGNERGKGRHASLKIGKGAVVELRWRSTGNGGGGRTFPETLELWFPKVNQFRFRVKPPDGSYCPAIFHDPTAKQLDELLDNGNQIQAVLQMFNPENGDGSLHIDISKGTQAQVQYGDWSLEISAIDIRDRQPIHAWLEELPNRDLFFLDYLDDEYTITIPGTAENVITVGAIEFGGAPMMMKPYKNSSSGPCRNGKEKPELVAPGVGVRAARVGSGQGIDQLTMGRSGTSVAAPHVAGAIALALSARAKQPARQQFNAFQIQSALQATPANQVWNETTGYGELDAFALLNLLAQV